MTMIDLNLVISCKTRLNTVDLYDHTESIIMTDYASIFLLLGKPHEVELQAIKSGKNLQALNTKCLSGKVFTGTNY